MRRLKYIIVIGISLFWWFASVARADTVLLNPASLAVGATVGEFLVVKESCPDPSKNCQANEKLKYVTAVAGRTGKVEFTVNLTDNFELDVNVDLGDFDQQAITLFKADNENAGSLFIRFPDSWIKFSENARENAYSSLGWQRGGSINNVELSAKNKTAALNINGTPFKDYNGDEGDTVVLDTSKPFVKLVIAGIQETDRLFEVTLKGGTGGTTPVTGGDFESGKKAGIQQCVSNPASCGITVSGGDFESGKKAGIQQCVSNPSSCGIAVSSAEPVPSKEGYTIKPDIWMKAEITTVEKGVVDAVWRLGGEEKTSRGDRVVWGAFFANPKDVTWGSSNNPDLYVKVWFDSSGRIDVNYFHVSVPNIMVYTMKGNGKIMTNTSTMNNRYVRHTFDVGGTQSASIVKSCVEEKMTQ